MSRLIKIAVTGPESTGKSMMAQQLADHFMTVWVPEFARVHLLNIGRPYNYNDIMEIAQKQKESERVFESLAKKNIVFSDTELLVAKIWCKVKYGKCHRWILDAIEKQDYDLYLLMDIDLPWEFDSLREHPDKRKYLFDFYRSELEKYGFNYRIINGKDDDRFKNALAFVDELLKSRKQNPNI